MKGDPLKLKHICPDWEDCLDEYIEEYGARSLEAAEEELAYNECCGCIKCVLFRMKVGCGDDCYMRQKYPQYNVPDEVLLQHACGVDIDEVIEWLEEENEYDPVNAVPITEAWVIEEAANRLAIRKKQLLEALEKEVAEG